MAESKLPDLSGLTVPQLRELIAQAEARIAEIQTEAKASLRMQMEELAANAGFTLPEILSQGAPTKPARAAPKTAGATVPVKYRGPNGEEWSGRGRMPKWLAVLEAEGKKKDGYLV